MAAARSNCLVLFQECVTRVLNNWTALQLALQHGMGGPHNQAVIVRLVDYITEIFSINTNIDVEDVADCLAELMDTEFQTLCEDNSPDEVGAILWRFYQYCKTGNEVELQKELNSIPVSQHHLSKTFVPSTSVEGANVPLLDKPVVENLGDVMEEDSEWTLVTVKKGKK